MDLKEFITGFANQFDDTDSSEITETTVFKDLEEWSSLTALSVIAFVKTKYGITISGSEIRACETVKELFDFITTK